MCCSVACEFCSSRIPGKVSKTGKNCRTVLDKEPCFSHKGCLACLADAGKSFVLFFFFFFWRLAHVINLNFGRDFLQMPAELLVEDS